MAPSKKKAKISSPDEKLQPTSLNEDHRTAWLLASDEAFVEIHVKNETFRVHKSILTRHSDYFNTCLTKQFKESAESAVTFDDIEPRYMAYYIGVAYSYSSIIPHSPPLPAYLDCPPPPSCDDQEGASPLRDYIEVYKLCDRFLSDRMGAFMVQCANTTIGDRHRALYRSSADKGRQRALMREFADAYEALNTEHETQQRMAGRIIEYFCEGIDYHIWDAGMDDVMDRPRFVAMVSKGFARKLAEAATCKAKLKRKELPGP